MSYVSNPPLPAGLSLEIIAGPIETGRIIGTPGAITSAAVYQITATNSGGSSVCNLAITVNDGEQRKIIASSLYFHMLCCV